MYYTIYFWCLGQDKLLLSEMPGARPFCKSGEQRCTLSLVASTPLALSHGVGPENSCTLQVGACQVSRP